MIRALARKVLGAYKHPRVRPLYRFVRPMVPTWNLDLLVTYDTVWFGPDQRERESQYAAVVERYASNAGKRCLQVGVPHGSDEKLGPNFVALDLYDQRECIDVRCDLANTPFEDGAFDFVVCNAVLEHVKDPFACAREIDRITAPEAEIWIEVPFVQPYHPIKGWKLEMGVFGDVDPSGYGGDDNHGGDYWRFTPQGLQTLFPRFARTRILLADEGGIVFFGRKRADPAPSSQG